MPKYDPYPGETEDAFLTRMFEDMRMRGGVPFGERWVSEEAFAPSEPQVLNTFLNQKRNGPMPANAPYPNETFEEFMMRTQGGANLHVPAGAPDPRVAAMEQMQMAYARQNDGPKVGDEDESYEDDYERDQVNDLRPDGSTEDEMDMVQRQINKTGDASLGGLTGDEDADLEMIRELDVDMGPGGDTSAWAQLVEAFIARYGYDPTEEDSERDNED